MFPASVHHPVEEKISPRYGVLFRSNELNRVFAAAVVNRPFCELLLKNPREALQKGYLGETFLFTPEEISLFASVHADTLSEFARQIYSIARTE